MVIEWKAKAWLNGWNRREGKWAVARASRVDLRISKLRALILRYIVRYKMRVG